MSAIEESVSGRVWRADVLVIGGGPAGTWAAISAAARGASVVLADKGYCGASGATAPSGTGVWYVEPDGNKREEAKASRYAKGGHLAETVWMDRVLAQTYANMQTLAEWGYPFPLDSEGQQRRTSVQGPEYMRLMRKRVKQAGVRILDHSPALQLLTDNDGRVCGASGISRQKQQDWRVEAGAVVIATGGCAFLSRALGCNVLTGDGHLMAAESGAQFSGMEFSNAYGLCPAFASVTKSAFYMWATFYHADGRVLEGAGSAQGRSIIAKTLQSEAVYARLDKADAQAKVQMRLAQPNFFLPFDRLGIDPFTQSFPVTLRLEGTVRGTGGLRIVAEDCATSVPGLFAAGDAATRELICGGFTGGGSHNAAWALSSGFWAGAGAAGFAQGNRLSDSVFIVAPRGAGLLNAHGQRLDPAALIKAVQDEVFPYERNWFHRGDDLHASLGRLDSLWQQVRSAAPASGSEQTLRLREASAMLAVSRWMYRSALARTETRGMHRRTEYSSLDPAQRHRVISGGLDEVWTGYQALAPVDEQLQAGQAA